MRVLSTPVEIKMLCSDESARKMRTLLLSKAWRCAICQSAHLTVNLFNGDIFEFSCICRFIPKEATVSMVDRGHAPVHQERYILTEKTHLVYTLALTQHRSRSQSVPVFCFHPAMWYRSIASYRPSSSPAILPKFLSPSLPHLSD